MPKRAFIIAITLLLFAPWAYSQPPAEHNVNPHRATSLMQQQRSKSPLRCGSNYGQEKISQEKPYKAVLVNGIWM